MSWQVGPAWPGRAIARWMLTVHATREPVPRPVARPAPPPASMSRGLRQIGPGELVLRVRISEQQLSWENLGTSRGQWMVQRTGPDAAQVWYLP